MSPTLMTFLFEAANFLVLAGLLSWLFFQPVRTALEARKSQLQNEGREAAEKLADAERRRVEQENCEAAFQRDLDRLRAEAKLVVDQEAERIRADARAAADRDRERMQREMFAMQESQLDRLAEQVAVASGAMVHALLNRFATDLDSALIRAACRELQALSSHDLAPVLVEAGRPLTDRERDQICVALGAGSQLFEVRVTSTLGSGVRISTARGLIDASSDGMAAYARRALLEKMQQQDILPMLHSNAPENADSSVLLASPEPA